MKKLTICSLVGGLLLSAAVARGNPAYDVNKSANQPPQQDQVTETFSGIDRMMMADYTGMAEVGVESEEPTGPQVGYDIVSLPGGEYNVFLTQDGQRVGAPAQLDHQQLYDQGGQIRPEAKDMVWEQPGNVDYATAFTIDAMTL